MAGMSWKKPPLAVVIGGTEGYLRDREIRNAVRITHQIGKQVVQAETDAEVVDALTMASTFGDPVLVLVPLSALALKTLQDQKKSPQKGTCILIVHEKALDEKKFPLLAEISGGYQVTYMKPTKRKDVQTLAVRFARSEAGELLGNKEALPQRLAEALVAAVGTDLGLLHHELSKITALARSESTDTISVAHIKAVARGSSQADMEPLREALRNRDARRMSRALSQIRKNSTTDPVMLLLRAKGGPADLALTWLRAAVLLEKGAEPGEISARLSVPEWAVSRDIIPAARRWGTGPLRKLIRDLGMTDRGTLQGIPAPWVSCETALLKGCLAEAQ